eukprot:6504500-Prymnesium_polylepis.1
MTYVYSRAPRNSTSRSGLHPHCCSRRLSSRRGPSNAAGGFGTRHRERVDGSPRSFSSCG